MNPSSRSSVSQKRILLAGPPWTVGYVCRPLDSRATQTLWIKALSTEPRIRHVHVLTATRGAVDLPSNVTVHAWSRWRGGRLLGTALPFYRTLMSIPEPVDFFFVVGGGPFPALLLPLRLMKGTPVYHWKALPVITRNMRFYARYCDDLIFTATPSSLPLSSRKIRIVGHGIDTEVFQPQRGIPERDLIVLGRVSPIKQIERAIELVAAAHQQGYRWSLDIVGPASRSGQEYLVRLKDLARRLEAVDLVDFRPATDHSSVPLLLSGYRAMVSFSDTAFDKAVGEAMACGLPVLTTNRAVLEDLPADLRAHSELPESSADQVAHLTRVLTLDDMGREVLGSRYHDFIEDRHSLAAFFGKILDAISAEHPGTSVGRTNPSSDAPG